MDVTVDLFIDDRMISKNVSVLSTLRGELIFQETNFLEHFFKAFHKNLQIKLALKCEG